MDLGDVSARKLDDRRCPLARFGSWRKDYHACLGCLVQGGLEVRHFIAGHLMSIREGQMAIRYHQRQFTERCLQSYTSKGLARPPNLRARSLGLIDTTLPPANARKSFMKASARP